MKRYETMAVSASFLWISQVRKMGKMFEQMALNNPSDHPTPNQQCQNTIEAAHLSDEVCGYSKHQNNQTTKLNHQDDSKIQRLFNDDSK